MQHSRWSVQTLMFCTAMLVASPGRVAAEDSVASDWPTRGWQTSSPEAQGMNSAALAKLVEFGASQNMDSLLIVRHGKIVLDVYYAPYSADMPHVVNSVTKAIVGTLASIAMKDGLLQGADQPMLSFFSDRSVANLDDRKRAITLQSLFDMTSGLARDGTAVGGALESSAGMERSKDWVQYILDRAMAESPGGVFNYDSGNAHLISAILTKVTGMSTEDYARGKLFGPLGITRWTWRRDPQGVSAGGYGLALNPHDMAKLGYLYLHNGMWDDKQLVQPGWVDRVSHATVDMKLSFAPAFRYSNFFWAQPRSNVYWASGLHCQLIFVYPAQDLVAVTTGRENCPITDLVDAIPKAVESETALDPDSVGSARLANAIRIVATEEATDVGEPPAIAAMVSGKTYTFPGNALGVKSMSLTFTGADPRYDLEMYTRNPTLPPERFGGPLGFDGRYRKGARTPFGVIGVKGRWLDSHTFEMERRTIGEDGRTRRWTLSFDGDRLNLRGKNFDGVDVAVDSLTGG
jgi:CubicO group peptidase (beta-lactamase class C family)